MNPFDFWASHATSLYLVKEIKDLIRLDLDLNVFGCTSKQRLDLGQFQIIFNEDNLILRQYLDY